MLTSICICLSRLLPLLSLHLSEHKIFLISHLVLFLYHHISLFFWILEQRLYDISICALSELNFLFHWFYLYSSKKLLVFCNALLNAYIILGDFFFCLYLRLALSSPFLLSLRAFFIPSRTGGYCHVWIRQK